LRTYRTRNTGTSSQFDYTTTGTRASLFCDTGIYPADWVRFWQGHAYGGMCSRDAAETPRGAIDQEACKERLFTAKSRDYQKSQEGKERGERSRWWGNDYAHSPDAVRFLYSNFGFLVLYLTLMAPDPPLQTEYVRLHRATIADPGNDAGRAGTARAAAAEAEGPEVSRRGARPRNTSCARNTSLTSGVEYCTTPSLFRRRG
jgi:hypothetical protein